MSNVLRDARVATRLPCQDLERARRFYAERLGLEPAEEREGGLLYRLGDTAFALFASTGAAAGTHTQMAFDVDDIEAVVAELRGRGVTFEPNETPFPETDGITEVPGNYPSKGRAERGVWLRDSEGNVLGIGQSVRYGSQPSPPVSQPTRQ
jgi:catechol 2,3-dioxygenase-like lactoylglutathione lyase family enzyme